MKYLIFLVFGFLLFSCSNSKSVYWCGDHACINKKERKTEELIDEKKLDLIYNTYRNYYDFFKWDKEEPK